MFPGIIGCVLGLKVCPLVWRGVDHQKEALLGGRELRDIVIGMSPSNMLLHGAKAFLLKIGSPCQILCHFFSFSYRPLHLIEPGLFARLRGERGDRGSLSREEG